MRGRALSFPSKTTSTTGPMICEIFPVLVAIWNLFLTMVIYGCKYTISVKYNPSYKACFSPFFMEVFT